MLRIVLVLAFDIYTLAWSGKKNGHTLRYKGRVNLREYELKASALIF